MEIVSLSHIGFVRSVNEDRCMTQINSSGLGIAIVADGMGGHNAGDIASEMAIDLLIEQLHQVDAALSISSCMQIIQEALVFTNQKIFEKSMSNSDYRGMGTTLILTIAYQDQFIIAHIGDSRAYLIQNNFIHQLTTDHTLVSELIKTGQISEMDAETHPQKNILTRALGTEKTIEIEIECYPWKNGDVILLCTDGLSGIVNQDLILDHIKNSDDLQMASQKLIQSALDSGGFDNITLALIAHDEITREGQ